MSDAEYARRMKKINDVKAYDLKVTMWVLGGLIGLVILGTVLQGGCDAARQKRLDEMKRENKAWEAEKNRKAFEEDVERGRESWRNLP